MQETFPLPVGHEQDFGASAPLSGAVRRHFPPGPSDFTLVTIRSSPLSLSPTVTPDNMISLSLRPKTRVSFLSIFVVKNKMIKIVS